MSELSKSSRLKEYLFSEVFVKNKAFKCSYLRKLSIDFLGDEYSDGVLNGVLYRAVANGELKKVDHGTYELLIKEDVDVKKLIESSLKDAFFKIQSGLSEIEILDLSNEELMLVKELNNIKSEINSKLKLNL